MTDIKLYKDKVNQVGGLINEIIKSTNNLDNQLVTLKTTLQGIGNDTYNLQGIIDNVSSSSKSEGLKREDLQKLNKKVEEFLTTTVNRDNSASDEINKSKEDFYTRFAYLKPEVEKNAIEIMADNMEESRIWCKKHWKLIATVVIVAVAIALLASGVGSGVGATVLAKMLAGACWGAIYGAVLGGVSGGLESMANGGSFLDGFEEGAFTGAISGAIAGALFSGVGLLGGHIGQTLDCVKYGKAIYGISKTSSMLSTAMYGFDMLALADSAVDREHNPIADLNQKIHSNKLYNLFQTGTALTAVFTGGMLKTMQCFVAGTLVLTVDGLKRIEDITTNDKVLAIDTDTMQKSYKNVLETFERETDELVHIYIGEDELITTVDHPFWVKDKGFVSAECLIVGSELLDDCGNSVYVENIFHEKTDESTKVYNLKVEDFHTFFVYVDGKLILVHNANYKPRTPKQGVIKEEHHEDGSITYTKKIRGKEVSVTYSADGYPDFSPFAHPDHKTPVKIKMTGVNSKDFKLANEKIGLKGSKPPKGYTWHHMEDGESMILVRREIHDCTVGGFAHTGGASIVKNNN